MQHVLGAGVGSRMLVVLSSTTSSAWLSVVLGVGHSGARVERGCGELTEAAHPPFRIDEGSGGTGVALLPASAAGLQMGDFKWEWEGEEHVGGGFAKPREQCYTSSSLFI